MSEPTNNSIQENMIAIMVAILVFVVLYLLKPVYPFQPRGIILPMVPQLPQHFTNSVMVYQATPYAAKPLAYINVEGHSLNPTKEQQLQMLHHAEKLARQAGGNGLVVNNFGFEGPSSVTPAPLAKFILFGEAIKAG